jgi:hypothetical protein
MIAWAPLFGVKSSLWQSNRKARVARLLARSGERRCARRRKRPGRRDRGTELMKRCRFWRWRAELYGLRVDRLRAELLDRRRLEIELGQIFGVIRAIIAGTRMSGEEKEDVYRQLMSVPELLEIVAEKQTRQEPMRTSKEVLNGDEEN